jgi:hypothetical protein
MITLLFYNHSKYKGKDPCFTQKSLGGILCHRSTYSQK